MSSNFNSGQKGNGEPPVPANPAVHYEPRDVPVSDIYKGLFALLVAAVVIHVVIWIVYGKLAAPAAEGAAPVSLVRGAAGRMLPPEPRLQGAPGHEAPPQDEFRTMRDEAEARLDSYGWVDQNAGIARIPIEQAMRLLVEKRVRKTATGAAQPAGPASRRSANSASVPSTNATNSTDSMASTKWIPQRKEARP